MNFRTLMIALVVYELFLKPKKTSGTDLLAQNPYPTSGDVTIEGGPSNVNTWENPYWRDWKPGDPTP